MDSWGWCSLLFLRTARSEGAKREIVADIAAFP
jgi:hypothetical protein